MALTKTGANILSRRGAIGLGFGLMRAMGEGAGRVGKALGRIGEYAVPATTTAFAANDVASGQRSLGEAVGEVGGGTLGYMATDRLLRRFGNRLPGGIVGGVLKFALPAVGYMSAADKGSQLMGRVMPWRRSPITAREYLHQ